MKARVLYLALGTCILVTNFLYHFGLFDMICSCKYKTSLNEIPNICRVLKRYSVQLDLGLQV